MEMNKNKTSQDCSCADGDRECYFNVGRAHWGYCEEHRLVWPTGLNLFSSWQSENESDWNANKERFAGYKVA